MAQRKAKPERRKKGNKHMTNSRRRDRKALGRRPGQHGNCGSSFCTRATGCRPWRTEARA